MSSREVLERRIDAAADHRERRRSAPLGVGYYTPAIRANAKAIGASMLAAAEIHGVTLVIIDDCDDLAATALDLASSLALRRELAQVRR